MKSKYLHTNNKNRGMRKLNIKGGEKNLKKKNCVKQTVLRGWNHSVCLILV